MIVRKFTNCYYLFHSNEHYLQTRAQVVAHMHLFCRMEASRRAAGALLSCNYGIVATVFKGAAIRIEALCPLSGNIVCRHCGLLDIQPPLDYMAIVKTLLLNEKISYALRN